MNEKIPTPREIAERRAAVLSLADKWAAHEGPLKEGSDKVGQIIAFTEKVRAAYYLAEAERIERAMR